jgi:uncharacterized membrane protein YfcA
MIDVTTLLIIFGTFLLAGTVKGVIGLGLPTVSLAILTVAFDLPQAMALLLVPSFVTNLWQAMVGGHARELIARLWLFFATATCMVWVGALALTRVDLSMLSALLGALIATYAALSLIGVRLSITERKETWVGPVLGTINGVLTGMTGSFVVPGVMFLQSIGLSRDMLIQAMGILFTLSTLALSLALGGNGLLDSDQGVMSATGLLPAIVGMMLGQRIRTKLSEDCFRKVFFIALLVTGAYIIVTAIDVP